MKVSACKESHDLLNRTSKKRESVKKRTPLWYFTNQLIFVTTLGMRAMARATMAVRMISGIIYMPL